MKTKRYFGLLTAGLIIFSTSCKKDDTGAPVAPPSIPTNVVVITKDIATPTTWSGDSVYVIKKQDFHVKNTLTIKPGAIIKFHPTEGRNITLDGSGTINASGNASKPIIFTSYKDDKNGGDCNGDGNTTSPEKGDWDEINTNGMQGSNFAYCYFMYGGGGSYKSTLELDNSAATVSHCIFAHNKGGKDGSYYYGALAANEALKGTVIKDNRFYDNELPLSINTTFDIDNSNSFESEDASVKNTYNGIFLENGNEFDDNVKWEETEVAFVIDDNDLWINGTHSLQLADNVVIKFVQNSTLTLANGVSNLINYDGSGVVFTSYKDDSYKGDTNGDGNATTPANGDWSGIYDDQNSTWLSRSNILYSSH